MVNIMVSKQASKYIYRAPLITSESEALWFAARGIKSSLEIVCFRWYITRWRLNCYSETLISMQKSV